VKLCKLIVLVLMLTSLVSVASADVKLAGVFGDHMVLQRGVALPVWGWADPGEEVTVTLGGQTKTATAAPDGKWSVRFNALQIGEPLKLTATGKKNTVAYSDVLVGEVWLCSGQSNMSMAVKEAANKDVEIAAANYPHIRMCYVEQVPAKEPAANCDAHWDVCTPQTVARFSATAYYFGRELQRQLNIPIGLINSSWGGTKIQTWTSIKSQEAVPELKPLVDDLRRREDLYESGKAKAQYEKRLADWQQAADAAKAGGKPFKDAKPQPPQDWALSRWMPAAPGSLYNGMIAPLVPYAIRGTIWYQGEFNAGSPIYGTQLATLIANWRDDWKQGDFPFIFVQLPNFFPVQTEPSEPVGGWALEREQFFNILKTVKNTGMAVAIDIGEAKNIHPLNKQEVGRRVAQWALARDGDKLTGFAIAGADKKFVWADARIAGDTIVVSSGAVPSPVAVRYAWANNPICNLVNKAGLPASPFRTDDWK
jgi:sialate O-acetylesterase